jgi:tRNA modification GTPase
MVTALGVGEIKETPRVTNIRHVRLLERARTAIARARNAAAPDTALSEEFVLSDLQDARAALEEISGRRTTDDLLTHIFSSFCIGK